MTTTTSPTSEQVLTLQELADEPGLGLEVVVPGDLQRPILGAHAIEIDHPSQWLRPGTIMLTTGLRFANHGEHTAAYDELIDELNDASVAALLFGIGIHFDRVPLGLINAARRHDFSVMSVAGGTPFHVVEDFVTRSLASTQQRTLTRALRLHEDLLRTLATDDPVSSLIRRLSVLSRGSAVLYDSGGHVIAANGEAPQRLIWQELTERPDGAHSFVVGRWIVRSQSITISGARMYVAIAARTRATLDELGETILTTTMHILAAANGIRSVTQTHQRAEARRILNALEAGLPTSRVSQTWARLRSFGLRAGEPMRYLMASPIDPSSRRTARRPSDAVSELARKVGLGLVLSEEAPDEATSTPITAIVADSADLADWLNVLGATHTVGLSRSYSDLTSVPHRIQEALAAWRLVQGRREKGNPLTVMRMDELDLASWVIARNESRELQTMMDRQVAVLDEVPDIRATVVTYLALDQDPRRSAKALFVHVNTVRYRLQRAEQLLGAKLTSAALIANLYLVLQDEISAARAGLGMDD